MNKLFNLFFLLFITFNVYSQWATDKMPISITTSQNGIYSIKSISYDYEYPTLRGISIVYKNNVELYRINRSFDLIDTVKFTLAISNDGRTVVYLINKIFGNEKEMEFVTVYKDGSLVKTYNMLEFTSCDSYEEKCALFYDNFYEVVDLRKSKYMSKEFKK